MARATRRQGANASNAVTRGEQTAELTATMETAEDEGGKGPRPAQFNSDDGARVRLYAVSTTYWRLSQRREVMPVWGAPVERMTMGPRRTERDRG